MDGLRGDPCLSSAGGSTDKDIRSLDQIQGLDLERIWLERCGIRDSYSAEYVFQICVYARLNVLIPLSLILFLVYFGLDGLR